LSDEIERLIPTQMFLTLANLDEAPWHWVLKRTPCFIYER